MQANIFTVVGPTGATLFTTVDPEAAERSKGYLSKDALRIRDNGEFTEDKWLTISGEGSVSDLLIIHNHGTCLLRDVKISAVLEANHPSGVFVRRKATGIVVSGGETSRLFHAASTTKYKVGATMTWDLWGRQLRRSGNKFTVDLTTCG